MNQSLTQEQAAELQHALTLLEMEARIARESLAILRELSIAADRPQLAIADVSGQVRRPPDVVKQRDQMAARFGAAFNRVFGIAAAMQQTVTPKN